MKTFLAQRPSHIVASPVASSGPLGVLIGESDSMKYQVRHDAAGLAKAAPVTYNVGGFANISGDASYIVEGTLVMDDTNLFSAFSVDYNLLSLDLDISNGTTTYTLSADSGFMTYFRPSITDTEYFADGWFINTDLGTIYDLSLIHISEPTRPY